MDKTSYAICCAFLQKISPSEQETLLKHVSTELKEMLLPFERLSGDPTAEIVPIEEELDRVHASWLDPFLRSLPEGDIRLALGCLSHEQQQFLKQSLLFSNHISQPPSLVTIFLKKQLFAYLVKEQALLPLSCLPLTSLNALLTLTYAQTLSLLSLLAMHDLSIEIRQIIDKMKLNQIHSLLSAPQTNFLNTLLHRKEPVIFKKMELSKWGGNAETLQSILQQRGLNRLAKALYPQDPSLVWYVMHRLDVERGALLSKLCTSLDHPRAASLLGEQVSALISSIKNEEE